MNINDENIVFLKKIWTIKKLCTFLDFTVEHG